MRIPKPCLSVPREKKSQWLRYVNVSPTLVIYTSMERFTGVLTTAWKPKIKKFEIVEIEFCPYPEKRNRLGFVDISHTVSPTLVINTSMERFSRVLQHEKQKIAIFFLSKKVEIVF